jgi:protein MpaA
MQFRSTSFVTSTLLSLVLYGGITALSMKSYATNETAPALSSPVSDLKEHCVTSLEGLPGPYKIEDLKKACVQAAVQYPECQSVKGQPIFHYEKKGTDPKGKKVFTVALIHGDEIPAGSVARAWISRLENIEPRNTWRVIAIANPDGLANRTRYNSNGVDINRNFASTDWDEKAISYWESQTKKDKRRNPGTRANSEPETKCIVRHIDEFKPDFAISVHTPLGVLDFDGPPVGNPGFKPLPWVGLGNFPGSLGRYLWVDRKIPVLTIELKGNSGIKKLEDFDHLQDITGTVAIQAGQLIKKNITNNK